MGISAALTYLPSAQDLAVHTGKAVKQVGSLIQDGATYTVEVVKQVGAYTGEVVKQFGGLVQDGVVYTGAQCVRAAGLISTLFLKMRDSLLRRLPSFAKEEPSCGKVGKGKFPGGTKVLFLNGSRYNKNECVDLAKEIAKIFESKIRYQFIQMSVPQVIRWFIAGKEIEGSSEMTKQIKEFLAEHADEKLLVIVHSGGGGVLESVRKELTEEERQRIDVVTFGSVKLFKEGEFRSAKNFVAKRDFIPGVAGLFSGHLWNYEAPVKLVGPSVQWPLTSHDFYQPHHMNALKKLRVQYLPKKQREAAGPS